jgi:biopolymer transport protein ExbB/TolQ
VNQQNSMFKLIILSIFVFLGIVSWFLIMVKLFKNVIRGLKEKKDV